VPMASLRSGDYVLTQVGATPISTRVLLNEHVNDHATSATVTLKHATGELTLTPDHVIQVDGKWASAREVRVGSLLSGGRAVEAVVPGREGIINPITTSGTILAASKTGEPVLATVYGDWIAHYVLTSSLYPALSIASALSYLFPEFVQDYVTTMLETTCSDKHLKMIVAGVPAPMAPFVILGLDLTLAVGFAAYCLLSGGKSLLAVAAIAGAMHVGSRK